MIDRNFLCNRNINEANSLPDLVQSINPDSENELPGYTMVNDFARSNKCGGSAIYVHSSFSLKRLDTSKFMQNSTVYEAIFLEIYNNNYKYIKYIVGSLYRRPSQLVADITQFTEEFSETLAKIHANCKQSYINGDYNIDLLQMHRNNYFNSFYENITSQCFSFLS